MIGRISCIVLAFTVTASFFFVTSLYAGLSSEWSYSRAAYSAQQEKWADAQQGMSKLMVDNPDDAELLYDSGVVAYCMKEFEKAEAYFNQSVCCDGIGNALKKQIHFNMGNTKVALKKLAEAIEPYEAVLAIDPDDERAKHNLEVVRQMLQQQQQQEQQQQQGQQNDDKNKQQNQQDKQNQNKEQEKGQEQQASENGQKQDGENGRNEQQKPQSADGQKQQDGDDMSDSQSEGQQEESQRSNEQEKGDEERNASDESNDKGRDQEQKQLSGHDSSPQTNSEQTEKQKTKDAGFHNTQGEEKEQEMQAGAIDEGSEQEDVRQQQQKKLEQELAPHERWMARVLQRSEEADEKANKRMVKAAIDKELAGKNGQNCW